jgi:hypothetical protein
MPARLICFLVSVGFPMSAAPATPGPPAAPAARAAIEVEFLADGRCTVSATGEAFHSSLTYMPRAPVSPTSELRCAIPPVPADAAVDLTVVLPRGASPLPGDEEPRLTWTRRDYRWIGTAALTAAPLVVRIPESGNRAADRARAMWSRRWGTIAVSVIAALAIASWIWSRDRKTER